MVFPAISEKSVNIDLTFCFSPIKYHPKLKLYQSTTNMHALCHDKNVAWLKYRKRKFDFV